MIRTLVLALLIASPAHGEDRRMKHSTGTFEVKITPASAQDAIGRMAIDKTFAGGFVGTSKGEMLTAGDPGAGNAVYVAAETMNGTLDGKAGGFALIHRGVMVAGKPNDLLITIAPGSGTGALAGIEGTFTLTIEGGVHRYDLAYALP
jgi:hypothetical protein